jgi:predicted metal-dependent hydrolase
MSADRYRIEVGGVAVEVQRKPIRHARLAVYPPDGRVTLSVPRQLDEAAVERAVLSKLDWIRRKRAFFSLRPRLPGQRLVSGESHYYQGRRYRLNVIEQHRGAGTVVLGDAGTIQLHVRPELDTAGRHAVMTAWYRRQLKAQLPGLLGKWEPVIGVGVAECRIRRMKTRWGSCNIGARRIWLNLDLARVPAECLEYVLVHEMVHLLERYHNDRFHRLMDRFLPDWKDRKEMLEGAPLGQLAAG